EGTTGVSGVLFDAKGRKVAREYREIPQFFPKPGWVEHDAAAIWDATKRVLRGVLKRAKVKPSQLEALGITNQRETVVAWDAKTGNPLARAIVWQCRRTADMCQDLKKDGEEDWVRRKTGLVIDPYFSGSKVRWLVENIPKVKRARRDGRLRFGTIDSWLIHRLTGGAEHATDGSNASRTLLMDLGKVQYDAELLDLFKADASELPEIRDSSGEVGSVAKEVLGGEVAIAGVAGDQQAALFGQACFEQGMTKNTYGTGCFALANAADRVPKPPPGILGTFAWRIRGRRTYALEGSVFIAGAVVQWLRDGLQVIGSSKESQDLAASVKDDGGVVLVPAFTGLGAPHWDPYARGAIFGITRGTTKAHVARAALQSIALQSAEVVKLVAEAAGGALAALRVDGGATENGLLMQYQADILDVPVERAQYAETTAQGAAFLAGLGVGLWKDTAAVAKLWRPGKRYAPRSTEDWRSAEWKRWRAGVDRAKGWVQAAT
ncbi:MAG TPA: glycerol kinase GlpK, partial [Candidatus Thermoplasmatota archaeon]|nr:glycerol kinase GlpK [Candidatus Thermoplasmatota archaeon]